MAGHDIKGLEKSITALSKALANLNSASDLRKLILIIRKPGWTTPAEFMFAAGIVDSMLVHAKAMDQLKDVLLRGSGKVGLDG